MQHALNKAAAALQILTVAEGKKKLVALLDNSTWLKFVSLMKGTTLHAQHTLMLHSIHSVRCCVADLECRGGEGEEAGCSGGGDSQEAS